MAAASSPSDAADSRHVIPCASRGKHGCSETELECRRMEDDRRVGEPSVIRQEPEPDIVLLARSDRVITLFLPSETRGDFAELFVLLLQSRCTGRRVDL